MEAINKILDMIAKWDGFGQGLFFFLLFFFVIVGIIQLCKLFVVLFRGWPPASCNDDEDEECCTGKKGSS